MKSSIFRVHKNKLKVIWLHLKIFLNFSRFKNSVRLAQHFQAQGHRAEAITIYEQVLKQSPHLEIFKQLGQLLVQDHQINSAIETYQRALDFFPNDNDLLANLGSLLLKQKQTQVALVYLQRALEKSHYSFQLFQDLGTAYFLEKQWRQAIPFFKQAIEMNQASYWSYQNLGNCFYRQQQYQEAEHAYRSALHLKPKAVRSLKAYAASLFQQNYWQEAFDVFRQAINQGVKLFTTPWQKYVWQQLRDQDIQNLQTEQQASQEIKSPSIYYLIRFWFSLSYFDVGLSIFILNISQNECSTVYYEINIFTYLLKQAKKLNQINKIIDKLQESIQKYPHCTNQSVTLAGCYEFLGDVKTATQVYHHATLRKAKLMYQLSEVDELTNLHYRKKIDFLVIGSQKGGTTALHSALSKHLELGYALKKEFHFWSLKFDYGLDWYFSQFIPQCTNDSLYTLDSSPTYLDFPGCADRVAQLYPTAKIIVILRDPVKRAASHYYHMASSGCSLPSIDTYLRSQLLATQELINNSCDDIFLPESRLKIKNYVTEIQSNCIARGLYGLHLRQWFQVFPKSQIKIIDSKMLRTQFFDLMYDVQDFLNLQKLDLEPSNINAGFSSDIPQHLETTLRAFYEPYNQLLFDEFGIDLN